MPAEFSRHMADFSVCCAPSEMNSKFSNRVMTCQLKHEGLVGHPGGFGPCAQPSKPCPSSILPNCTQKLAATDFSSQVTSGRSRREPYARAHREQSSQNFRCFWMLDRRFDITLDANNVGQGPKKNPRHGIRGNQLRQRTSLLRDDQRPAGLKDLLRAPNFHSQAGDRRLHPAKNLTGP